MGEFALAQDAVDIARRHGLLQRDFQGYYAGIGADLLGLGVSAAGRMGATYSQNARAMADYCDLLDHGRLPVVRGLVTLSQDRIQVTAKGLFVIETIACVFDRYLQFDRARQRSPQPI